MTTEAEFEDQIECAAAALRAGRLVAFPTETVFGLGADATNASALRRLYAAKGRPADHPVIVHLGEGVDLAEWATEVPEAARVLADAFWPGPLTLVLRAAARVSRVATGGLETVGLRVPAHPVAIALLAAFGGGIAAPSANRFGRVSSTTAEAARREFGSEVETVLDGACAVGIESTIVDCTVDELRVLRPGAITVEQIGDLLGVRPELGGATRAPGTLATHYAPDARVEIVAAGELDARIRALTDADVTFGVIAFASEHRSVGLTNSVTLATPASVEEYANVLYSTLRKADDLGMDVVLAVAPPAEGLGVAVMDRLGRAAAGR